MPVRLRRYVGLLFARFRFRKSREKIISFSGAISNARNVLVIMPFDRRLLLQTVLVIEFLRKTVREENLTFVSSGPNQELLRMVPRAQFITLLASDLGLLYLPSKALLDRIRKQSYDCALDLNLDFLIPSAYICKASDARVRIGFARKHADPFFNFQIQSGPVTTGSGIYDRMTACLQMF
jgi:ADP-heptose:LPS heptosyltransferase